MLYGWKSLQKYGSSFTASITGTDIPNKKIESHLEWPYTHDTKGKKIAVNSKGKLFKVSGALKDSLENRPRRNGYVTGIDVPQERKKKL